MTELLGVFHELVRLEIELWEAVDHRLRGEHGLPLSQFEPLQTIGRRPGCRVLDISEELRISIGGTSKLVDRIENAGWCRRVAHPDDGRSSLIELTDAGRQLLTTASQAAEDELRRRISSALSAPAARRLGATLAALRESSRSAAA